MRSGRAAGDWRAPQRRVPSTAPCGSRGRSARSRDERVARVLARQAGGDDQPPAAVGMSLIECTARSMRPSSNASSISLVNRPLPPISASGRSWMTSPVVVMATMSMSCGEGGVRHQQSRRRLGRLGERQRAAARADAWGGRAKLQFASWDGRAPLSSPYREGIEPEPAMIVLGIETSCDETAAAVVERERRPRRILANLVLRQVDEHARLWRRRAGNRRPRPSRRIDRVIGAPRGGRRRLRRSRRHRRHRRARADRRRHRRRDDRQGDRAGARQAAARGQSSRSPCADGAADRRRRFPICCCWSPAAIASC